MSIFKKNIIFAKNIFQQMTNHTPLRYPGGKSLMTQFFIDLIEENRMHNVSYAEPFAGGAGTAVNLLIQDKVDNIHINDANICIYSFWKSITEENERFVEKLMETPVSLDEWRKMHNIIVNAREYSFDLGFATFFLSRTNRSGILTAGPIGGNSEEKQEHAKYKIDCRFNKEDLARRIIKIGERNEHISVTNKDAILFLKEINDDNILLYLDPPYYVKGKSLYLDFYNHNDHQALADYLTNTAKFKWILSYDNVHKIREMYKGFDQYEFFLNYTVQEIKRGSELLTHSKGIILPKELEIKRKGHNIPLILIND